MKIEEDRLGGKGRGLNPTYVGITISFLIRLHIYTVCAVVVCLIKFYLEEFILLSTKYYTHFLTQSVKPK